METSFTLHECSRCREPVPGDPPFTISPCCQALLLSRYDLSRARGALPSPGSAGPRRVWRCRAVLPLPAGARAGIPVSDHSPEDTPAGILAEIRMRGARLTPHPGSIVEAGRAAREESHTGGAFDEMEALGWIRPARPRLYAVQSAACAPIVGAFRKGWPEAPMAPAGPTLAAGLRVPVPFAHREILPALRRSGAVAVAGEDIREAGRTLAVTEGILACPEGAAAVAGAGKVRREGAITSAETVVVFQTASGRKYLGAWGSA